MRLYAVGLQNVGINRALRQEANALEPRSFFIEHLDEFAADDLALFLRLGHAGEEIEEAIGRVHVNQVRVHLMAEYVDDLLALALAHQPVIDMHADELLADGLDQKRRDDGRVHAAGQRQQDLLIADLRADGLHLFFNKRIGERRRGDALHRFGADIRIHFIFLLL